MISVVGPGGVGGLLAGLLRRAGIETVVVARDATARRIATDGLTIESAGYGTFHVDVPTATDVPRGSAAIVTVKGYGLADVLPGLAAARPAEVLTLLNGVSHADLVHAALDGPAGGRVACGSVGVVSARGPDGVIEHRSGSAVVTAHAGTADWEVMRTLAAAGVTVHSRGTETEVLWRKLRFLSPMALLTAWTDLPIGAALRADPATTDGVVREVAAVAGAAGVPTSFEDLRADLFAIHPAMTTSLQLDVRRRGPNELDVLGTRIIELGAAHGVDTPYLQRVVDAIGARVDGAGTGSARSL